MTATSTNVVSECLRSSLNRLANSTTLNIMHFIFRHGGQCMDNFAPCSVPTSDMVEFGDHLCLPQLCRYGGGKCAFFKALCLLFSRRAAAVSKSAETRLSASCLLRCNRAFMLILSDSCLFYPCADNVSRARLLFYKIRVRS